MTLPRKIQIGLFLFLPTIFVVNIVFSDLLSKGERRKVDLVLPFFEATSHFRFFFPNPLDRKIDLVISYENQQGPGKLFLSSIDSGFLWKWREYHYWKAASRMPYFSKNLQFRIAKLLVCQFIPPENRFHVKIKRRQEFIPSPEKLADLQIRAKKIKAKVTLIQDMGAVDCNPS